MNNIFFKLLMLSIVLTTLSRCTNEKDTYYDEPSWVKGSLYEILQQENRFDSYLKCVDRTLHAPSLKGGALYTCFAPNDEAFDSFLRSENYKSVDDIPQEVVNKIVSYSLVYNSFRETELSDILHGGWDTLQSIKKKTPYYETIRKEWNGTDSIWVMEQTSEGALTVGDNNYKYLPFYMARYFDSRTEPLTANDYNTLYPNSTYTGRNVQSASIVTADLQAGNGMIHEVNEVLLPLSSLGKIISENKDFSLFNDILEMKSPTNIPYFFSYSVAPNSVTALYQKIYPSWNIDQIYGKLYNTVVPIYTERYGLNNKQAETDGYTLIAPNNKAVQEFFNSTLKPYGYQSLNTVPYNILQYFVNSQMVEGLVWPGQYKGKMNGYNDYLNGKGSKGDGFDKEKFYDIRPASNGFFFGSKDYIKSHYFETVFTEILLNPEYSLFNHAFEAYFESSLKKELMRCALNNYEASNFIVLLPSDELLSTDGFSWVWGGSSYNFTHSNTLVSATNRMHRLVKSHVFKRINNAEINTSLPGFTGNPSLGYDGYGYAVNDYGDMIRFKNNQLQMLGNYDENEWVSVTLEKEFMNGAVYKIDKLLQYSRYQSNSSSAEGWMEQDMLTYLKQAGNNNPDISIYTDYMSYMLDPLQNTMFPYSISPSSSYTILMPNNEAMQRAITSGDLPALEDVKKDLEALQKAINFMRYHVLTGPLYMNDGYSRILLSSGAAQAFDVASTTYKELITSTFVRVEKDAANSLKFSTQNEKDNMVASVVKGVNHSNLFGNKAVLHEVDNYLKYIGKDK